MLFFLEIRKNTCFFCTIVIYWLLQVWFAVSGKLYHIRCPRMGRREVWKYENCSDYSGGFG